jgi:hypothetical protein
LLFCRYPVQWGAYSYVCNIGCIECEDSRLTWCLFPWFDRY